MARVSWIKVQESVPDKEILLAFRLVRTVTLLQLVPPNKIQERDQRLVSNKDRFQVPVLWMDERQIPESDVRFDNAPYFNFNDGDVKFDTNWVSNTNDNYGSASGFLPKHLL